MSKKSIINDIKQIWLNEGFGTEERLNQILSVYKDKYEQLYYMLVCGLPV